MIFLYYDKLIRWQNGGCNYANRKLTTISKDGKWKSFRNHAGLMQYVPSGVYFARAKVAGNVKRASLETDLFPVAKDRLHDKLKAFS